MIQIDKVDYSVVSDPLVFFQMRNKWNRLLVKAKSNNIYLTWEWLYNWWEVFKNDRELFILIAQQEGEFVGIFPLLKRKITHFGYLPYWRLEFLSTGENEKGNSCPCSMEIVAEESCHEAVYTGFVTYLIRTLKDHWDELVLTPLFKDTVQTQFLLSTLGAYEDYHLETTAITNNIYTHLPDSWDKLLNQFGKKTRKRIRRGQSALEDMEEFAYEFLEDEKDFSFYFDTFTNLHNKRWNNSGSFASEKFVAFQEKVCQAFMANGWLRFSVMRVGDTYVAGNIDFGYGDTLYGYQTTFDQTFAPQLSIGFLGMTYCFEDAIAHGYKTYDWYREGDEGDYKNHFSPAKREVLSIRYAKRSFKEALHKKTQAGKRFLSQHVVKKVRKLRNKSLSQIIRIVLKRTFESHYNFFYVRDLSTPYDALELPEPFNIKWVPCEKLSGYIKEKDLYVQAELDLAVQKNQPWLMLTHQGSPCGYYKIANPGTKAYIHDYRTVFDLPPGNAYLVDMEIDEKFRGKSLGQYFKSQMLAELKAMGCKKVISHVPSWNIASHKMNIRSGTRCFKKVYYVRLFGLKLYTANIKNVLRG
jgi:CelD/BcsL family acetyltransferase involved in cellulose biosynthesis